MLLNRMFGQPASGSAARGPSPSAATMAPGATARSGGWTPPATAAARPATPVTGPAPRMGMEADDMMNPTTVTCTPDAGENLMVEENGDGSVTITAEAAADDQGEP